MKHFVFLLGCVFFLNQSTFSQSKDLQQKAFDSIFYYTYMNIAATNPDQALKVADSLYETSTTSIQKIRSLMLISDMYFRKSNRDSTVRYALKADRIASRAGITAWRARIYGVLSTQYRKNGQLKHGYTFLDRAQEVGEKVEKVELSNQIQGQIYQERGYCAEGASDYVQANVYFKTSDSISKLLADSPTKSTFRAQNEYRIGANFFELGLIDSPKIHSTKALELDTKA